MKKLILTACLASCLATTPYAAQAMQPSSGLKAYCGKATNWISQHKAGTGLCAAGIAFIIAALCIAPTITEIFNAEDAEKASDGCWIGCSSIQERVRKIQQAQQLFAFGVTLLIAGGCKFGYDASRLGKGKQIELAPLNPVPVQPLPPFLPTGLQIADQKALQNTAIPDPDKTTNFQDTAPVAPTPVPMQKAEALNPAEAPAQPQPQQQPIPVPLAAPEVAQAKTVSPAAAPTSVIKADDQKQAQVVKTTATSPEKKHLPDALATAIGSLAKDIQITDESMLDVISDIMDQENQQAYIDYLVKQTGIDASAINQKIQAMKQGEIKLTEALTK